MPKQAGPTADSPLPRRRPARMLRAALFPGMETTMAAWQFLSGGG